MTARQTIAPTEVGDSLTTYLADIANHELLTADDEVELAQAIEAGREAEEKLAAGGIRGAEKVRLEYGESTPFRVLEKESDLVSAENQKIAALFTYRKSVVDLHRAQGTILQARNIVVEEAAPLR